MSGGWEAEKPGSNEDDPPPGPADDLKAPLAVLIVIASAFFLGLLILALSVAIG